MCVTSKNEKHWITIVQKGCQAGGSFKNIFRWFTCLNGGSSEVCGGEADFRLLDDMHTGGSSWEPHTHTHTHWQWAGSANPRAGATVVTGWTDCSPALHTQPVVRALGLSLFFVRCKLRKIYIKIVPAHVEDFDLTSPLIRNPSSLVSEPLPSGKLRAFGCHKTILVSLTRLHESSHGTKSALPFHHYPSSLSFHWLCRSTLIGWSEALQGSGGVDSHSNVDRIGQSGNLVAPSR